MATREEFLQGTNKPITANWLWDRFEEEALLRAEVRNAFIKTAGKPDDEEWWELTTKLYQRAIVEEPMILGECHMGDFHVLVAWVSGGAMMDRNMRGLSWDT